MAWHHIARETGMTIYRSKGARAKTALLSIAKAVLGTEVALELADFFLGDKLDYNGFIAWAREKDLPQWFINQVQRNAYTDTVMLDPVDVPETEVTSTGRSSRQFIQQYVAQQNSCRYKDVRRLLLRLQSLLAPISEQGAANVYLVLQEMDEIGVTKADLEDALEVI